MSNYWVSHTLGFALDRTRCCFPSDAGAMREEPFLLAELGQGSPSPSADRTHPASAPPNGSKSVCKISF